MPRFSSIPNSFTNAPRLYDPASSELASQPILLELTDTCTVTLAISVAPSHPHARWEAQLRLAPEHRKHAADVINARSNAMQSNMASLVVAVEWTVLTTAR